MRRSRIALFSVGVLAAGALAALPATAGHADITARVELPDLRAPASVVRDVDGIAHVRATNPYDLFFLNGWVHADDRLFQMDVSRRQASGTLAELLGNGAIASDVQMRTIGLRRAAERSVAAYSPEVRAALQAYADGVNAWTARNPLPNQYGALKLSKVAPWTTVDSTVIIKLIAFGLSFDLDIDRTTTAQAYRAAGAQAGFDGAAAVAEDLFRFQPFNPAAIVPDATGGPSSVVSSSSGPTTALAGTPDPTGPVGGPNRSPLGVSEAALTLAAEYQQKVEQIPVIADALNREVHKGSNSWVIGGRHTATGRPILASDPHLNLDAPSTFYPIALNGAGYDVQGDSFAGSPFVILGQNRDIAWGATMNPMDVTDTFVEQLRPDDASPSGLSTVYQGRLEPVQAIAETFRVNTLTAGQTDAIAVVPSGGAIPARTFVVPRRNNGPLLSMDPATGTGLSVQYTGFSATRELDAFRLIGGAHNVNEFRDALQFFDVGSQNFTYADVKGHIAHFTSAEQPLREDLQAGTVRGNPPYLLRDGTGGNEWLPVTHRQPNQALPYEILPFNEMPQTVDPAAGYVVTANNDPAGNTLDNNLLNQFRPGGGIFYLGVVYDGARAGRITDLVRGATARGRVTTDDVLGEQADVTSLDSQFFTPYVVAALDRARRSTTPALAALAADPRVVEAVGRFARWNHTMPTGIPEGYDANDRNGVLATPSQPEIDESVAATIYTLWRGQYIRNVIDTRLAALPVRVPAPGDRDSLKAIKQLLVDFDARGGVGRSGLDFYAVPGVADAADRRDVLLLRSVADALTLLAGDAFAPAFGRSADQGTYRWGLLHRFTLASPLGAPFSIPSAGNPFPAPLPGLPGIPVDGGYTTVDVSSHNTRADAADEFSFRVGPSRRFLAQPTLLGMRAVSSSPGGTSETLGDRFEQNLLRSYLTNDTYRVRLNLVDLLGDVDSITTFLPDRRR